MAEQVRKCQTYDLDDASLHSLELSPRYALGYELSLCASMNEGGKD